MTVLEPVTRFLMGLEKGAKITLEQVILGAERPRLPVLRVMDRMVREGFLVEIEDMAKELGGRTRILGDTIPSFGGHDPESNSRFGSCPPKSGHVPQNSHNYLLGGRVKRNPVWKMVKKPLVVAVGRPRRRTVRDKLWTAIRMRRLFCRSELAAIAEVSVASVESYIRLLKANGYLRETGKNGREKVYLLVKGGVVRPGLKELGDSGGRIMGDTIPNQTADSGHVPHNSEVAS